MLKLIKNADVYTPAHIGISDILIADERIANIAPHIDGLDGYRGLTVFDAHGMKAVPGFIDLHVHITGGGGEDGFASRVPESYLTAFTTVGVTTVLGLLGTDGVTRSIENLYAKSCALTEEGITCHMLTGAYQYPSPTITGSIDTDIMLLDRCIGAKVALSDHRSPELSQDELLRLASLVRRGGLLSGKAGLLTIHMGNGEDMLNKLFYAIEHSDVPIKTFLPTHVSRNSALFDEAIRWMKAGGCSDLTAGEESVGRVSGLTVKAIDAGVDPSRITVSSDAFGSQPKFDEVGRCIGLTYGTSRTLMREFALMVRSNGLDIETALSIFTSNPARVMGLSGKKGELLMRADADIVLLDDSLAVSDVFARGRLMVKDREPVAFGKFGR